MINVTHRLCAPRTQASGLEGLFSPCQGFLREHDRIESNIASISSIHFCCTTLVNISRARSIVHREYGGGFRICVPGEKVKFDPLSFITPCYSSRRLSRCFFHNDKGKKSRLSE